KRLRISETGYQRLVAG
ncbi:hypothetical protein ACNVD4_10810, partial [Rhizobium sp. BR5]